jgi:hypothetical protein
MRMATLFNLKHKMRGNWFFLICLLLFADWSPREERITRILDPAKTYTLQLVMYVFCFFFFFSFSIELSCRLVVLFLGTETMRIYLRASESIWVCVGYLFRWVFFADSLELEIAAIPSPQLGCTPLLPSTNVIRLGMNHAIVIFFLSDRTLFFVCFACCVVFCESYLQTVRWARMCWLPSRQTHTIPSDSRDPPRSNFASQSWLPT